MIILVNTNNDKIRVWKSFIDEQIAYLRIWLIDVLTYLVN